MIIKLLPIVGSFAENKEKAKDLRLSKIMPALQQNQKVTFDFFGVEGATQSFIHALVSDPIRHYKQTAYDNLYYKNINEDIQEIVSTVYRYMQESLDGSEVDDERL
ncbi:MAG: STAS-like domain-containing protein [Candidatus Saccharibacteria bacterium]|nr:STAS-like domain-containing protein [Candidatus Saccharibacteria bacterium]